MVSTPWLADAVSAKDLTLFLETAYDLIKRKYLGERIADHVQELVNPTERSVRVKETKDHLALHESRGFFWASEYMALFSSMEPPEKGTDWKTAVRTCEEKNCGIFFIKTRADQQYHDELCKARASNRRAYNKVNRVAYRRYRRR